MTVRTTSVRLRAEVSGYVAGLGQASRATRSFVDDARNGSRTLAKELQSVQTQAGILGAALLALPAAAIAVNTAFDKQMSGVQAVAGATAEQMTQLRTAAIEAGQATAFSASDAAKAEAELAKAGIKTSDILGGALTGSLSLAAAGQIDLADAATISAQAMNTFGLQGQDVGHIADVLASGANKSAADVGQLGDALRQGGLVAQQTGLSLEDTVAALSAFADRALIGSDAGTSLKTMLQRLTPQSQQAADEMKALGIHAYDAKGNFVGLAAFAENLRTSMSKLTPEARNAAMSIIFGSDAVRGANVLYDLGAKGVESYTAAVDDQGAATRMAATQMDNLAGDLEQLKGSIETALIQSGSEANGVLREMTQAGTGVVNFVGDLPGPILATGLAVTAMSGAFLIAAPRIVAVNEALAASPALARAASIAFKGLGAAAGVAVIAGFAMDLARSSDEADTLRRSVDSLFGTLDQGFNLDAFDQLNQKIAAARDAAADPGIVKKTEAVLLSWKNNFLAAGQDATDAYNRELRNLLPTFDDITADTERLGTMTAGIGNAAGQMGVSYQRALELASQGNIDMSGTAAEVTKRVVAYAKSQSSGSAATHKAAAALDVFSDSTASAEDRLKALKDQWDATTGALLGASNATIAAEKALDDMTDSVKENGNAWDIQTPKGRANQSMLNDSIQTFEDLRLKLIETGQATEEQANKKMAGYLTQLRDRLPKTAKAARAQLQTLIDKYNEIPPKKSTQVTIDTSQATTALNKLGHLLDGVIAGVHVAITASGDVLAHGTSTKTKKKLAGGGWVDGPGTSTSDSVDIRASRREYVVNARAAAANASLLDAMNYGRQVPLAAMVAPSSRSAAGVTVHVTIPPTVRPADRALIREQVTGAVQEAMAGVGGQIAWRGKR